MPLVSVILATYNRAELLKRSAGSVLAQSFSDLELIVVDDCSDVDIAAVVSNLNDPRVRYLRRNKRGGPAAARNSALVIAQGQYVAFQDDDDEWLLDKLELQLRTLSRSDDQAMCLCALIRNSGRLRPYPQSTWPDELGFADIAVQPRTYTQTWLVPRAALLEEQGFDERLWQWEDWELLLRLALRLRILTLPQTLALSAQSEGSLSHDTQGFARSMTLILDKHADSFSQYPKIIAGLLYVQARLLIGNNELVKARRLLRRALRLHPNRLRAWQLLAISYLGRGFVLRRFSNAAGTGDTNK